MESWHRPYTPEEIAFLEKELNHFYNLFLEAVSQGRAMSKEEVDKVGQGRVWSGVRAKEKGLVDRMGGLSCAIDRARELGSVPPWVPVADITPGPGLLEKIVGSFTGAKAKGSPSDLAAMVARAAGLDALYPMALLLLREEETPIALCPLTLEL
jgi:ClpP class serine protease